MMIKTFPSPGVTFLLLIVILQDVNNSGAEDDWVTLPDQNICAVRGSSVVMPCSFTHPSGFTATKVFWLTVSQWTNEAPDLKSNGSYKGRVQYLWKNDTNCALQLNGVKKKDSTNYYARIVTNDEKQKWLSKSAVQLSVTELRIKESGVRINKSEVIEGGQVQLNCSTTCRPNGNHIVIWRKNGQDVPTEQTANSELKLLNVSVDDGGNYSCALKDHTGLPSTPVEITVMFSPKNTSVSIPTDVMITKGSSVIMTCSSDAIPPVENYTWFKVDESTPVGSGQQYSITNISSEDGGQYYCEARNKYGAENSTAVLITVTVPRRPVMYIVAGVSVCGAAGLICLLVWISRTRKRRREHNKERSAGPPSAEAAGGADDDGHYPNINPNDFRQTTGAQEDDVQYASVLPKCSRQTAGAQGDDVQYASVQFKKAGAAQGAPDHPEGELSVIYSSVKTKS
ncbi:B-cell receptor CD22-like [Alosa sapidissima]|uniref:B-cell receptor CD22-like n=1 Tax=Alosa sapidissima TaxID=34773 RepID=UPI001C0A2212|nr:B-cell receptor CD22-like [Alosa sapidissima]